MDGHVSFRGLSSPTGRLGTMNERFVNEIAE